MAARFRDRSYSFMFVIHNQGEYNDDKKKEFRDYIQSKYPLKAYLIAQELYPNEDKTAAHPDKIGDSHLQGNLYFKNQVDKKPLLEYIQAKYPEGEGAFQNTWVRPIVKIEGKSITAVDNYINGSHKWGADPNVLTDMALRFGDPFEKEFKRLMDTAIQREATRRQVNLDIFRHQMWEQQTI